MKKNWKRSLKEVLRHEGGYSNHPDDPGGHTFKGITIGTYRRHINPRGTVTDLRSITDRDVENLYRKHYWDRVKGDQLPAGVDLAVFDFAVNSGVGRASRYLQRVVGVEQDGVIGPVTLAAVKHANAATTVSNLSGARMRFLAGLSTWPKFRRGWTRRVNSVKDVSLEMISLNGGPEQAEEEREWVAGHTHGGKQRQSLADWLWRVLGEIF